MRIPRNSIRRLIKEELYRRGLLIEQDDSVWNQSNTRKQLDRAQKKHPEKITDENYEKLKMTWIKGYADSDGDHETNTAAAKEAMTVEIKRQQGADRTSGERPSSVQALDVGGKKGIALKVLGAKYEVVNMSNEIAKGKFGKDAKRQMNRANEHGDEKSLVAMAKKIIDDEGYVQRLEKAGFGSVIDDMRNA